MQFSQFIRLGALGRGAVGCGLAMLLLLPLICCGDANRDWQASNQPVDDDSAIGSEQFEVALVMLTSHRALLPLCISPAPGYEDGEVPQEIIERVMAGTLTPTDGTWYDVPPEFALFVRVRGFEYNAVRVESISEPGKLGYVPLVAQPTIVAKTDTTRPGELPSGEVEFRYPQPTLHKTGQIESWTKSGELDVRLAGGESVRMRPVLFTWYYGAHELGHEELRYVFGVGSEPWPANHKDNQFTDKLSRIADHVDIYEAKIFPDGRLERVKD